MRIVEEEVKKPVEAQDRLSKMRFLALIVTVRHR
jgi:hypothetical protein